jgi:hypothetical protein
VVQRIEFEGQVHEFPDDFSEADISSALSSVPAAATQVPKEQGWKLREGIEKDGIFHTLMQMASDASNAFDEKPSTSPDAMALKGVRDGVAGLSQLPADMGMEAQWAKDAKAYGQGLPQLDLGTANNIGASAMQFGLPGGAAMQGVSKLLPAAAGAGRLAQAGTTAAKVGAVAAADAAVMDPTSQDTISGIFLNDKQTTGGQERVQQLVETPAMMGMIKALSGGVSSLAEKAAPYMPSGVQKFFGGAGNAAEVQAARQLDGSLGQTGQAVRDKLDANQATISQDVALHGRAAPQTAAEVVGPEVSPELTLATNVMRGTDAPAFIRKDQDQMRWLNEGVGKMAPNDGPVPDQAMRQWVEDQQGQLQAATRQAETGLEAARANVDAAKVGAQEAVLRDPSKVPHKASEDLALSVRGQEQADRAAYGAKYPDMNGVNIDAKALAPVLAEAKRIEGLVTLNKDGTASKLSELLSPPKAGGGHGHGAPQGPVILGADGRPMREAIATEKSRTFNLGDLERISKELGEQASELRRSGQAQVASQQVEPLQARVNQLLDDIAKGNHGVASDVAQQYKSAREEWARGFAPLYQQEASAGVFRPGANREASRVANEDVAGAYVHSGQSAVTDSGQLRQIVDRLDPAQRDAAIKDIGDYLIGRMGGGREAFNSGTYRAFQQQHAGALEAFPEVAQRIDNLVRTGSDGITQAGQRAAQASDGVRAAQDAEAAFTKGEASHWIGKDPKHAVGSVMGSGDPAGQIKAVVKLAEKDPSGNAVKSVRQAFYEHFTRKVQQPGKVMDDGTVNQSFNKFQKAMRDDPKVREAYLETFTTPEQRQLAQRMLNVIDSTVASKGARATVGSDTWEKLMQHAQGGKTSVVRIMMMAGNASLTKVNAGAAVYDAFMNKVTAGGVDRIDKAMTAMLLDPEAMRIGLKTLDDSNAGQVAKEFSDYYKNYVATNALFEGGE